MWQVDFGRRVFVETEILDVADDADDLSARVRLLVPVPSEHDALADRILVREETPGRRLAEHGHLRRFSGVGVSEQPAALQRDAKRREVVRRRHSHLHRRLLSRLRRRAPLDIEGQVISRPVSGRPTTAPAERTPGNVRSRSRSRAKNCARRASSVVRRSGSASRKVKASPGRKPGSTCWRRMKLLISSPAAVRRVTASAISDDDERTAHTGAVAPGERPAAAVLERRHRAGRVDLHGGDAAEEQSRQERRSP